jgi:hypothetical protein
MKFLPALVIGSAVFVAVAQFAPVSVFDVQSQPVVGETVVADPRVPEQTEPEILTPTPPDNRPLTTHVPIPEHVRSIYMSSCVAGTPSFRERLVTLINETELNAVMIDVKDYSGTISFRPESAAWLPAWNAAECGARDMKEFIASLHAQGIFVIGRITVFQDPFFAPKNPGLAVQRSDQQTVWQDGKGLSFVDVASQPYWDHIIELSMEAYNIGFDELNFDYVRYPSDGNMQDIWFPQTALSEHGADKAANLEAFFSYLKEHLDDDTRFESVIHQNTGREKNVPWTSADLFGMTTSNNDDLSIGQVQERAAPYFDFIAPMVYPSHYPKGFLNGRNPNDYPYEVVYKAMARGVERMQASTTPIEGFLHTPINTTNASGTVTFTGQFQKPVYTADKFRTWIQDFDYGGDYDAVAVRAQMQASYDAGVHSWMIWAPSNIYTRAALQSSEVQ